MIVLAILGLLAATQTSATLDLGREQRISRIGYRLAVDGESACRRKQWLTGFVLHDIAGYDAADRYAIEQAYGLGRNFGVRLVVPGSAAERAGIKPDDIIETVGKIDLGMRDLDLIGQRGSAMRSSRAADWIAEQLRDGSQELTVRHGSTRRPVTLKPDHGCAGSFVVAEDKDINAWSDGKNVAISARLVDLLDDDELAFALAHEMAHNILNHAALVRRRLPGLTEFGVGTGKLKAAELEADAMGVELMRRAGFNLNGAEIFLRKIAAARGPSLGTTHPGYADRIARIRSLAVEGDTAPAQAL